MGILHFLGWAFASDAALSALGALLWWKFIPEICQGRDLSRALANPLRGD